MEDGQATLGFEPHTLVRKDDPITSREAAESVETLRGRHWGIIRESLRGEPGGLTSQEIADGSTLEHWAVTRRMGELETAGKIIRTQETRKNRSGRKAIVWRSVR